MIAPRLQWCHQIVTTSLCWPHTGLLTPEKKQGPLTACSNCTRMLGHEQKRNIMTPDQFQQCIRVAKDFVYNSPPCPQGRINKCIGIFGGEPLMSPFFPEYVEIACAEIPEAWHRGLWTSFDWPKYEHPKWGAATPLVHKLLGFTPDGKTRGFLNWNMHDEANLCEHQPVLIAIKDVVKDEKQMWELINKCWLNRDWSAAYALNHENEPKFYFCEIASSFARAMHIDTGLPVEPGVWNHDLELVPDENGILRPTGPYANQITTCCTRCSQPLPMKKGRRDFDLKDDISQTNLDQLIQIGSPMVKRGDYELFDQPKIDAYNASVVKDGHYPGQYIKKGVVRSSTVQKASSGPVANPSTKAARKRGKVKIIRRGKK